MEKSPFEILEERNLYPIDSWEFRDLFGRFPTWEEIKAAGWDFAGYDWGTGEVLFAPEEVARRLRGK